MVIVTKNILDKASISVQFDESKVKLEEIQELADEINLEVLWILNMPKRGALK